MDRGPEQEPRPRRSDASPDQGKVEGWHQTLKNRIMLENYFLPGDLECQIEAFVEHYNHRRYGVDPVSPDRRRLGLGTEAQELAW